MGAEVPVFMTKVECPVCKTVNEYETIKMGAYVENGRDTDFCPTNRVWRNPKYQHVNPLLYFMASCSSCFYTREFNKNFKEWKTDSNFRSSRQKAVREKHLNALAGSDGLIKALGTAMNPREMPQETAIVKLLLAIFDELMLDRPSYLDIGRWYLRIAWVFREMSGGLQSTLNVEQRQKSRLSLLLKSIQESFGRCARQIEEFSELVEGQPQVGPTSEDPYRTALFTWRSNLDPILQSVDSLLVWRGTEPDAQIQIPADSQTARPFAGYPSFDTFLNAMAEKNNGVPQNELEAVSWSLLYYRRAYEESHDVTGSNQKIQVAYMIGELARRVGENENAWQYFNIAIRTGQEVIHLHRDDPSKTALARKIMEMAREQAHACNAAS
jgi:uncharacterized protein (DUF2225 family)